MHEFGDIFPPQIDLNDGIHNEWHYGGGGNGTGDMSYEDRIHYLQLAWIWYDKTLNPEALEVMAKYLGVCLCPKKAHRFAEVVGGVCSRGEIDTMLKGHKGNPLGCNYCNRMGENDDVGGLDFDLLRYDFYNLFAIEVEKIQKRREGAASAASCVQGISAVGDLPPQNDQTHDNGGGVIPKARDVVVEY